MAGGILGAIASMVGTNIQNKATNQSADNHNAAANQNVTQGISNAQGQNAAALQAALSGLNAYQQANPNPANAMAAQGIRGPQASGPASIGGGVLGNNGQPPPQPQGQGQQGQPQQGQGQQGGIPPQIMQAIIAMITRQNQGGQTHASQVSPPVVPIPNTTPGALNQGATGPGSAVAMTPPTTTWRLAQ